MVFLQNLVTLLVQCAHHMVFLQKLLIGSIFPGLSVHSKRSRDLDTPSALSSGLAPIHIRAEMPSFALFARFHARKV